MSPRVQTAGFRSPVFPGLAPLRDPDSLALEEGGRVQMPPFVRWDRFLEEFEWQQGEHITLTGTWGSGKTTLARQLLPRRDFVVVLATKRRDPSLYEPLLRTGYELRKEFSADADEAPKVIFQPPLESPTKEGREDQREKFRHALVDIFDTGNWCVYADEIRYLTQYLNLQTEFEQLWLQGRSLGISIVSGTQRPVSIPILAFDANHLFFYRTTDKRDIMTMSEFTGTGIEVARHVIPRLPKHEVLYVDTRTGRMVRTKVQL